MSNIRVTQALGGDVTEFTIQHEISGTLPERGVSLLFRQYVGRILRAARREFSCFKVYVVCQGVFQRGVHDEEIKCGFYAKTETCTESADIDNLLERMQLNVLDSFESFEGRGSGYIWKRWEGLTVKIIRHSPVSH